MRFFFASRVGNIRKLRPQSLISSDASVVYNMNRYDFKSGKKWSNEDLEVSYNLEKEIKFKKDRIPDGHPYLYKGVIMKTLTEKDEQFPKLFKNKENVVVTRVDSKEYIDLIHSKKYNDYTNFN